MPGKKTRKKNSKIINLQEESGEWIKTNKGGTRLRKSNLQQLFNQWEIHYSKKHLNSKMRVKENL